VVIYRSKHRTNETKVKAPIEGHWNTAQPQSGIPPPVQRGIESGGLGVSDSRVCREQPEPSQGAVCKGTYRPGDVLETGVQPNPEPVNQRVTPSDTHKNKFPYKDTTTLYNT